MAVSKTTTKRKSAPAKSANNVWTDEERAAMQQSARERKSQAKLSPEEERAAGEQEIQAKLTEMAPADRAIAERIHAIVAQTAPALVPRTYYGMPAYAKDGKTICFFQPASKFKVRYATFGFQPDAKIDDGDMFPVAFAVMELTPAVEARIAELVKKAVS
jgi:uncharacterized protein YdhG (YjbR/CyaY superfamily)